MALLGLWPSLQYFSSSSRMRFLHVQRTHQRVLKHSREFHCEHVRLFAAETKLFHEWAVHHYIRESTESVHLTFDRLHITGFDRSVHFHGQFVEPWHVISN